ncbi:MAG: Gfo/Idh/MocA family oxidoreductase [Actinomycetota bacterium]|nr:Gfo/Idh/MocA family oxidoreductase [Actinomycetota bacterium]
MSGERRPGVAVVGCGHWGRNLVRNVHALGALHAVVDVDPTTATTMSEEYGVPAVDLDRALNDASVEGVVVAVPAVDHVEVARKVLDAGKHALVEKPLALFAEEAEELCAAAERAGRVLMVGHVLQYHPAFVELERLVRRGALGRLRYAYSNRLNLGRIRRDESTLWSFAPHDVSMILALVATEPVSVRAVGGSYVQPGLDDVTTTHLAFPGGERAHVFVSWLHPVKEHKLVVVGDEAMAVFDDGRPWASKLRLFRHGVAWRDGVPEAVRAAEEPVTIAPGEPLAAECRHFMECMVTGATPRTDGREGLRVLRVLEAAQRSLRQEADSPAPAPASPRVFVHESAYVDEPCEIGEGTKVWHFSHLLAGTRIGRDCTLGQNVMVGPDVTVGDRCKIQNNVSVYRGVTLEDGVFCGPSCVFTNVTNPRAEVDRTEEMRSTTVGRGATIGANATVVCGHGVGPWAMVAAGAVVTSEVPAHALVAGVPARRIGWVSHAGERLGDDLVCPRTGRRYVLVGPDRLEPATDD